MRYKNPKITVDAIITKNENILLIKRKNQPFKDKWALPGGFVEYNETTEETAKREIFEETGLKTNIEKLFGVYSKPDRDPRGHTITIVYKLKILCGDLNPGDDASNAKFFNIHKLPNLAFDHKNIIIDYMESNEK